MAGYRALIGAAVAVLLSCGMALAQESEGGGIATGQGGHSQADKAAAEFRPAGPEDEQAAIDAGARQKAERTADDDLAAQQSMAVSAERMLKATWFQIVLSAAAIGGLLYSLKLTRDAVTVAEKTRTDADRHANLQSRAYIHVEHAMLLGPDRANGEPVYSIRVNIKNHGQTPAHDLVFSAQCGERNIPLSGAIGKGDGPPDSGPCSLAPGADKSFFVDIPSGIDLDSRDIKDSKSGLYVWGEITYRHVFQGVDTPESTTFTAFMMVYTGPISARTGLFADYIDGNSAT